MIFSNSEFMFSLRVHAIYTLFACLHAMPRGFTIILQSNSYYKDVPKPSKLQGVMLIDCHDIWRLFNQIDPFVPVVKIADPCTGLKEPVLPIRSQHFETLCSSLSV